MPTSATLLDTRAARAIEIVRRIDAQPGISRAELAEATGLGSTTIVRAVGELVSDGIVETASAPPHGRSGRPTERLAIAPGARSFVGLEFGRERLVAVVMDARRRLVAWAEDPSPPAFAPTERTLRALADAARRSAASARVPWQKVAGVGLAFHGVVTADGTWSTRQPAPASLPAAARLSDLLGRCVAAEDVSRAFALAEHRFGAGRGRPDLIYAFLGSDGVGGGIFLQGSPMKSTGGVCGEIGHLPVVQGGASCHYGASGCLETVATERVLVARYRALAAGRAGTSTEEAPPSLGAIAAAADAGDPAAATVLRQLARDLATALGPAVNVTGAPHVVIGGGLDAAEEPFRAALETQLRARVVAPLAPQVSVAYAELPGHAGAWGVALQAMEAAIGNGRFLSPEAVA